MTLKAPMDPKQSRFIDVRKLRLHSKNPRLPEHLVGSSQTDILEYLHGNGALDELAKSFLDNGFFPHEPLIVSRPDDNGAREVLEGNRRLAALTILLKLDTALELGVEFPLDETPTAEQLAGLRKVPCFEVDGAQDVHSFLGFRHIGGTKTWSAEAKARYLLTEVRRARDEDPVNNPFTIVGRAVGSNAQGVRNPYIAMSILINAREQFGIEISAIQRFRFGVWNRAMNSPLLRDYIGFGSARTFEEVQEGLESLKEPQLREVLNDMTPGVGSRKAVLSDSRDVTIYAEVLQNERAHTVLRQYDDLRLARQIVEQASIAQRIRQITYSIEAINREVERQGAPAEALQPANELARLARSLRVLIAEATRSDD